MTIEPMLGIDPAIWREFALENGKIELSSEIKPLRVGLAAVLCPELVRSARRRKFRDLASVQRIAIECGRSTRDVLVAIHAFLSGQEELFDIGRSVIRLDARIDAWCMSSLLRHFAPLFESDEDREAAYEAASFLAKKSSNPGKRHSSWNGGSFFNDDYCARPLKRSKPNIRFFLCTEVRPWFSSSSALGSFATYGIGISIRRREASRSLRTIFANGDWQEYEPSHKLFDEIRGAYLSGLLSYPEEWVGSGQALRSGSSGLVPGVLGAVAGAAAVALLRR